jgi:type II secretory pathway pseudopilin PulG
MKQKDIALIIVIVIVSGIASLILSRLIFAPSKDREQQVEVVDVITADFPTPDSKYFNANSVDPTQLIQIGDTNNPNPFNGAPQ